MSGDAGARTNGYRSLLRRTKVATAAYRRLPWLFRAAFTALATLRSERRPRCLSERETADAYLAAHTRNYWVDRWNYGYHRVFHLVNCFHPAAPPASLQVLSLGPRTEIELYYLWLFFGFSWDRLVGVDLVSSSPKITVADFSVRLPFADNTMDVIVASHCLEKSRDPERTRDEIRRVAKPGASVLACGNRPPHDVAPEGASGVYLSKGPAPIPLRFFDEGVYGLIDLYHLSPQEIRYLDAHSPYGYDIIFSVTK